MLIIYYFCEIEYDYLKSFDNVNRKKKRKLKKKKTLDLERD